MRVVTTLDDVSWYVGEIDDGQDGLLEGPGPEHAPLRQVVTDDVCWYSSSWISENGLVYQRYRNPYSGEWMFSATKSITLDPSGAMMVQIGGVGKSKPTRLARAIGLAWILAPRVPWKLQIAQIKEGALCASNLGWVRQTKKQLRFSDVGEVAVPHPLDDDEWTNLVYVWCMPNGDPLERFDAAKHGQYKISARGWLATPSGDTTRGHRTPEGRLWASVANEGAIWMDCAVLYSFSGIPSFVAVARHQNGDVGDNDISNLIWDLQPSALAVASRDLLDLLVHNNVNAQEASLFLGITRQTLWSRLHATAAQVPYKLMDKLWRFAFPSLRGYIFGLATARSELAFGPIGPLYAHMCENKDACPAQWCSLEDFDKYGMLLLARQLLVREQWAQRFAN